MPFPESKLTASSSSTSNLKTPYWALLISRIPYCRRRIIDIQRRRVERHLPIPEPGQSTFLSFPTQHFFPPQLNEEPDHQPYRYLNSTAFPANMYILHSLPIIPLLLALTTAQSIYPGDGKWAYQGCYNETTLSNGTDGLRALSATTETNENMTVSKCLTFCAGGGNSWAGLEYTKCVFVLYPSPSSLFLLSFLYG